MKKLLSFLMSLSIISSVGSQVLSCNNIDNNIIPLSEIGLDVDRSNAIDNDGTPTDNAYKVNKSISNYYVVGDSLLDSGGFETYINELTGGLINLQFASNDENDYSSYKGGYNHAFTNGLSAGVEVGRLIFGSDDYRTTPGSLFDKEEKNTNLKNADGTYNKSFGNNYAIGGSTAANLVSWTMEKESRSLVAQHKFQDNDLVFCDIGGNDLFTLIDTDDSQNNVQVMTQFKTGLENSLLTILNNGAKRVLYMTPPQMIDTEKYYREIEALDNTDAKNKLINRVFALDDEVYSTINEVLEEVESVNPNYKDYIDVFDLYQYFHKLVSWDDWTLNSTTKEAPSAEWNEFLQWQVEQNELSKAGTNIHGKNCEYGITSPHSHYIDNVDKDAMMKSIKWDGKSLNVNIVTSYVKDVVDSNHSFFIDTVHPTWGVVQFIGKKILQSIKEKGWWE